MTLVCRALTGALLTKTHQGSGASQVLKAEVSILVKYADLLSANFEYGGRGPKSFDCYGLVQEMYRRKGIETPNFDSPSREELQDYFANRLNHWRPTSLLKVWADFTAVLCWVRFSLYTHPRVAKRFLLKE